MRHFLVVALLCVFGPFGQPACAQQLTAVPIIGGMSVHCTDPSGATVFTTLNNHISDWAQSTIVNGVRLIILNPTAFQSLDPLIQIFTYAHECGHHVSGDIIEGVYFHHDNLNREKTADCIGIRLMRDQLKITPAQADLIASQFEANPGIWPYYMPGPQRAQWIRDCYRTNNNSCSVATAPGNGQSKSSGNSFCAVLKVIMGDAKNSFSNLRGESAKEDQWKSKKPLPGFQDCKILGTGQSASHMCTSEVSAADTAQLLYDMHKSIIRSCLGRGWKASDETDSDGDPYLWFRNDSEEGTCFVNLEKKEKSGGKFEVSILVLRD